MSSRAVIRCIVAVFTFCLFIAPPVTAAQDSTTNGGKAHGLTPCLAVAADGSPVWTSTTFVPSKQITVAFRLPADDKSQTLVSRWIALGDDEKVLAENTLELKGQKGGWLQLALKQPAPPGKYRVETTLDGKPWESIDLEVVAPASEGAAQKPADLIPLKEGTTFAYDLVSRPQPGTKIEIPGVKPEADGTLRATFGVAVGKTEDAGTHYTISMNDQPMGEMWVKIDQKGLQATRRKTGEVTKDLSPPEMLQPLPPSVENGVEWTVKKEDGGEQKLRFFGPLPMDGPDGPAAGYLVFSEEQTAHGSPGEVAARGKESIERYYIPGVGLVREVHVNTLSGKLTSRQELALSANKPYKLVANPELKGRLGRVQFEYPEQTDCSQANVLLFKAGAKPNDKAMFNGYGAAGTEVLPGRYEAAVSGKRVPIEVKSGHNTVPLCGVLRVHAGSDTHVRVLDSDGKTQLWSGYGTKDVPLPVGSYQLEIGGANETVKIEDGKVTEF